MVGIDRVVFVADSGLLSKDNLDLIEGCQKEYIVAAGLVSRHSPSQLSNIP